MSYTHWCKKDIIMHINKRSDNSFLSFKDVTTFMFYSKITFYIKHMSHTLVYMDYIMWSSCMTVWMVSFKVCLCREYVLFPYFPILEIPFHTITIASCIDFFKLLDYFPFCFYEILMIMSISLDWKLQQAQFCRV